MEFLKIIKRRSFINEVVYIVLNVGLAIALLVVIRVTGSLLPAFALVLLSKWRVLAVRPRFWFANIQADLVSLIVSVGFVVLLYSVSLKNGTDTQIFITQCISTLLYVAWLLFLRPKSKRAYVVTQAGVALFVGVTAIYAVSYSWIASPVVLLMWLVGYATARHVLGSYDEESHTMLLSLSWGLIMAEIGWLAYHWTIAYQLPIFTNVLLPQVSIITLCLGFLGYNAYDSYYHHQKVRLSDIILPLIFTISIIIVLVVAFNGVSASSI